jgi:hypothetical protein
VKKVSRVLIIGFLLLLAYNAFLFFFPLKKNVFYTNDERVEEFIYSKKYYPIVLVGSSLGGVFEGKVMFDQPYFNLFLPVTDACTGVEVLRRSKKIPKKLFVEINHIDRGIDTALIENTFETPLFRLKYYLPFLLKKNKLLPNIVDRLKKPVSSGRNSQRPPPVLFNQLLASARSEWSVLPDSNYFGRQLEILNSSLKYLSAKGCDIYFYEVPMDSSLTNSKLLRYQRAYCMRLAARNGYHFIPTDTSRVYDTGDGIHMLEKDADLYTRYFIKELNSLAIPSSGKGYNP